MQDLFYVIITRLILHNMCYLLCIPLTVLGIQLIQKVVSFIRRCTLARTYTLNCLEELLSIWCTKRLRGSIFCFPTRRCAFCLRFWQPTVPFSLGCAPIKQDNIFLKYLYNAQRSYNYIDCKMSNFEFNLMIGFSLLKQAVEVLTLRTEVKN